MSSDQIRGFDLVSQPWIRTRTGEQVDERSLEDTFASAHQIEALAGELPTQSAAVLRLLLAILRRSLPYARTRAQAEDQWRDLWEAEALPMKEIRAYLEEHRDRFDLLSPTTPFMQVPDLAAKGTSGLVKLIGEHPDGDSPYFTTRSGAAVQRIGLPEASRWVVHAQAYDPSGIKTGAVGDERVKGGKGYPIGTGWTGRTGLVVVEGANLKETLLLNLPLDQGDSRDRPVWERDQLGAAVEAGHQHPLGPVDIMTWPIRRIRLVTEGPDVVDVVISNGDPIQHYNQHDREPMTAWRRSQAQEKKNGVPVAYMPREHDPERALWRGLAGLLVQRVDGGAVRNEGDDTLPPHTLEWLAELQEQGVLARDYPVRVRSIGMLYGAQNSSTASVIDDALRLRLSVLTDERLHGLVIASLDDAKLAVDALAGLAGELATARGQEADVPRDSARATGYLRLDQGYRRWIASLSSDSDLTERRTAWQRFAKDAIRRLGDELVLNAGDDAFRGRDVERRGGGTRHVSSGNALLWFTRNLAKALPLATARPSETSEKELTHG
ncbi:CRISPR system Cascade subunit CasA [Barrientosiimonas humi]|uniref:CRISPR system Cascade subunit CasA n=1 Tax=Barrientosiimonas humi TaxID=999931 RepID=A0A542XFV1_9MICO|nr:type I-E CRISPR-associated protein Cse1/CasA [Barrientosiimonas humi]TQL34699.1 CRISPR system Cascade subunit CasA [Barrientosiimonas humi]CAG7574689.1 CRISPR-associated protein CasA/Cse1 [Barrientosiimonas humi]